MAEKDMNAEIRKLQDDFSTLRGDVSEMMTLLREMGAERVEEAKESANDSLQASRERLRRQAASLRTRGRETVDDLEDTIEGNPLGSVALAFGIGFVVAKLLDLGGRR
ncbi:hypothetical protein Thimo_0163 [Thioflavicoccus mobilis 8321]|uniref:DUF883 domain-containing protein n=1 Tax=Thioflavicoccus mobilis 8321 TaxID=765912 RepID=L0GQM7_9GAMM|nr:DUF883 family protein [Thioflavicoccus mobilis]AGA89038.1 hypothetical protein Thimo_0163 [Thioflavicoccus mobilis 8321]